MRRDMKNKKWMCVVMCTAALIMAAGCGNGSGGDSRLANKPTSVDDVLQAGINQQNSNASDNPGQNDNSGTGNGGKTDTGSQKGAAPSNIDVDLTKLSSTMVYSEVFNMMNTPEDYIGKTVKMDGQVAVYHDESTGNDYYACIIQDATACCAQGMEFALAEEYAYPADYPQEGDEVVVTGVFDTYMEGDYKYCTLRDSVLTN